MVKKHIKVGCVGDFLEETSVFYEGSLQPGSPYSGWVFSQRNLPASLEELKLAPGLSQNLNLQHSADTKARSCPSQFNSDMRRENPTVNILCAFLFICTPTEISAYCHRHCSKQIMPESHFGGLCLLALLQAIILKDSKP